VMSHPLPSLMDRAAAWQPETTRLGRGDDGRSDLRYASALGGLS
jgi:hypothetical protein